VPTAPPNWSVATLLRVRMTRSRWRSSAESQVAAFKPSVTGGPCCSQVRPASGVRACFFAIVPSAVASRARSTSIASSASRNCSTSPVSIASWLVAPECTKRPASVSLDVTRAVSSRTRGMAGLPASAVALASALTSNRSARHCAAIAFAAAEEIIPARASARARAASKSSIPCRRARSEKTFRIFSVVNSASNSRCERGALKPGSSRYL